MFLLKFTIFLTIFLLTKQELIWNFFSSKEFSTKDKVPLDLKTFAIYNNSALVSRFCLVYLSAGYAFIATEYECISQCLKNYSLNTIENDSSCNYDGFVKSAQVLRTYDIEDTLIFLSLEGCYSIDENGSSSTGRFIITNNALFNYYELLNNTYFWANIFIGLDIKCNLLCKDLLFDICYIEQTDQQKEIFQKTLKHDDFLKSFFISPLKQEANDFSHNIKIMLIVIGVVIFVIFFVYMIHALIKESRDNN